MVVGFQLPVQSVPITTNVVSSNPVHCKVYSIHYVIKFVSDLNICNHRKHVCFRYVSAFINIVIYSNVSIVSVFPDHTASMEVSTGVGNSCMFKLF